jgi:hypothetical protein
MDIADDTQATSCVLGRENRRLNLPVGCRRARLDTAIGSAGKADGVGEASPCLERSVAYREAVVGHFDLKGLRLACAATE